MADDKTVLITGCSSGFGLTASVAAASRGWRVFATMRNTSRRGELDEAVARAGARGRVEVVELDVTDPASVRGGVATVLEATGGRLDAVVNNAGLGDSGFFEDTPEDQIRRVMETNFFGALAVTREVLPTMRAQGSGRIVLVSSVAAFGPQAVLSVYAASKWAAEGWGEAMAIELAPWGIQVAMVQPGAYRTAIWENLVVAGEDSSPYADLRRTAETKFRAMVDRTGRDPMEVGERIVRLLEARRMRLRNPVGPDARMARAARRILPTRTRLRLARGMIGLPASMAEAPARSASASAD